MMNMVESVTTMGCRRSTAMKNPLKAPVSMPIPMPNSVHTSTFASTAAGSIDRASAALTSEIAAPAERSKPPDKMTIVWPMAASADAAPPLDRNEMSK